MEINKIIPLIIPSYEPDERLIELLEHLKEAGFTNIVLVNDGSDESYQHYFEKAESDYGCQLVVHEVNKGKGRALKNAFSYCLEHMPEMIGCVTADSDGQHSPKDIMRCMEALEKEPEKLILGVRDFSGDHIPWKSVVGNKITSFGTKMVFGIDVLDTQTGLRAIPKDYMEDLLDTEGERFEFEMNMLVEAKGKHEIGQVKIETIYDSKENHQSHFDPFRDSIKIYRIFWGKFLRFLASSVTSFVLDMGLFQLFCIVFKPVDALLYTAIATVLARLVSATYNYTVNYFLVFKSEEHKLKALGKYAVLALIIMGLSATLTTVGAFLLPFLPEIVVKAIVDVSLFFMSYKIQHKYVF